LPGDHYNHAAFGRIAKAINAALDAAWKDGFLKDKSDILEAALAAEREQFATAVKQAAEQLAENHKQQLAAEREKHARTSLSLDLSRSDNQQLRSQLAAAKAEVKTETRLHLKAKKQLDEYNESAVFYEQSIRIKTIEAQLAAAQSRVDNCKRLELESAKAQAALKLIQDAHDNKGSIGLSDTIVSSRSSDTTALDAAIAAAQQPLVDAINKLYELADEECISEAHQVREAALAKVKDGK
jgi:hypothetical protein